MNAAGGLAAGIAARAGESARRPVRVAYSGLFLRYPQTGTGRYARHVLEQLAPSPAVTSLVIADQQIGRLDEIVSAEAARHARLVRAPGLRVAQRHPYAEKLYWEQVGLRLAAWRLGVDVLYSPHFSLPLLTDRPAVVSIHDVIPLTEPGYADSAATKLYFALVGAAARRALTINTLSEYSRGEIARVLKIAPDRIRVIPPGVEPEFNSRHDEAALARARARLDLPARYLLYVGGSDARKNLGVLLAAAAILRARRSLADNDRSALVPPIVIAAPIPRPAPSAHHPDWRGLAAQHGLDGVVQFVERIAEGDLPAVYRGATALVFPSRAEGFGLTPLEAMACGTPVISSNTTSLPEAVGDAGILVAPDDARAWADAIEQLCADPEARSRLRGLGLAQAARFRWEDTGARVLETILDAAQCGF